MTTILKELVTRWSSQAIGRVGARLLKYHASDRKAQTWDTPNTTQRIQSSGLPPDNSVSLRINEEEEEAPRELGKVVAIQVDKQHTA